MINENSPKSRVSLALLLLTLLLTTLQCGDLDDRNLKRPGDGGGRAAGAAGAAGTTTSSGNAGNPQSGGEGGTSGGSQGVGGTNAGQSGDGSTVAECASGEVRCDGLVPQDCSDSGQWVARHAGCATACLEGECVDCIAQMPVCKDGGVQECVEGTWTTAETCDNVCEDGACVAACEEGRYQCNGPRGLQRCVGGTYVDDSECDFLCSEGECTGECMPTTRRCNPSATGEAQTCTLEGLWGESTACPADTFCVAGDCKPCSPGTARCAASGPQKCSEAGEWVNQGACAAPLAACFNGSCVSCTPGEKRCGQGAVEQCLPNGSGWEAVQTCSGMTPVCLESTKTCGRCSQGQKQCFNDAVQTCDSAGTWQTTESCSGATPRCVGNACVQCNPATNERRCETASSAQGCSASGSWSAATACTGNTPVCRADKNFSCGCEEGERRCRTNTIPEVCQGGAWVAQSACAGVLNHCLPATGQCVDCVPGTAECQSGTAFECTAQGAWRTLNSCSGPGINCGGCDLGESCRLATDCSSGFCVGQKCAACQPGQRRCQGNVPQLCSTEGAWTAQTACSGSTPQCLASTGLCVQCLSGSRACGTCNAGTQTCSTTNQWSACSGEPNLQTSNTHCGTCNTACGASRSCQAGTCQCNSGTHACGTTCYSNTDADRCGSACRDCSAYHGTSNTCANNQCACAVASLACGDTVPTCSSWTFESGVEGWTVGSYYTSADHGMSSVTTAITNGSRALFGHYDNMSGGGWAAEFAVNMCPNGANVNLTNYRLRYDMYMRTTGGSRFLAETGGSVAADTFLVNGRAVITACQPFLYPSSDTWLEGTCANLPATMSSLTIIVRLLQPWAGDIYIDNVRFEPE